MPRPTPIPAARRAPLRPLAAGLLLVGFAGVGLAGLGGCIPYAVGTTAATVRPGEAEPEATFQFVSSRRELEETPDEPPSGDALASMDNGVRFGLDERSDLGVRLVGSSGIVLTYKRRLAEARGPGGWDVAALGGAGVVGFGSHLHTEAAVVASRETAAGAWLPYGGLKALYLVPFSGDAAGLPPAVGAFAGARIGPEDLAISPEIGVFYQPSDWLAERDVVVVPSVTIHGRRLLRALGLGF